jgi:hypothetical protein
VREFLGEAGAGLDLQQGVRQVDARQARRHLLSQRLQARRIVQLLQRREDQPVLAVHPLDPHIAVRRQIGGRLPVGRVEYLAEPRQGHVAVRCVPEAPADLWPGRFPVRALEQVGAGIAPALAGLDRDVPPMQTVAQPLQRAEGIGAPVDALAGLQDVGLPGLRDERLGRLGEFWPALSFDLPQELQRVQDRLAAAGRPEAERAQQPGQELPHHAVARQEIVVVVILWGPRQRRDGGDGDVNVAGVDPVHDRRPEFAIAHRAIAHQTADVAEQQRRCVEIA